jgi:hypothetical protein
MIDAVFGNNIEVFPESDDEDEDESCDNGGDSDDDNNASISNTQKKIILQRNAWVFQMLGQTCTETQWHDSHLLLS